MAVLWGRLGKEPGQTLPLMRAGGNSMRENGVPSQASRKDKDAAGLEQP